PKINSQTSPPTSQLPADTALQSLPMRRIALLCLLFTACHRRPESNVAILLFNGEGASAGDAAAFEALFARAHLNYATANSDDLKSLSEAELRAHRLLI